MLLDKEIAGAYEVRLTTGIIAAAAAADATWAALRNGPTSGRTVHIVDLSLEVDGVVAFTAAQQFGIYMERFTAGNATAGTARTPFKLLSSYPNSACLAGGPEGGDCRSSGTGGLNTAACTFEGVQVPILGWTDPAVGKKSSGMGFRITPELGIPLKLLPGEGLALRNLVAWPAAGTAVITAKLRWYEA